MAKTGIKSIRVLACILLIFLAFGCASLSGNNTDNSHNEQLAIKQTKDFFNEHPEYLSSKELESQLFVEFQQVIEKTGNENLSMYQMLLIAHHRLQQK